jgi:N-succinyldiaminopimelate aminotransferase
MHQGLHQYAPSVGDPVLRQAVAEHQLARYGLAWDPVTDVTVTTGASEAITASLLALLEPGDEVVLIEPCYDLYPYAVVAAAGCRSTCRRSSRTSGWTSTGSPPR